MLQIILFKCWLPLSKNRYFLTHLKKRYLGIKFLSDKRWKFHPIVEVILAQNLEENPLPAWLALQNIINILYLLLASDALRRCWLDCWANWACRATRDILLGPDILEKKDILLGPDILKCMRYSIWTWYPKLRYMRYPIIRTWYPKINEISY